MFRECLHCLYFMKLNIYAEQTLLHMFSPIDPNTIKKLNLAQKLFPLQTLKASSSEAEHEQRRFRATMSVS